MFLNCFHTQCAQLLSFVLSVLGYEHLDHVLATENDNAVYQVDSSSNRHSVRVPLHLQQGCDHALINYKFMCKTSCSGGLNRSPTDVIFTLEDEW